MAKWMNERKKEWMNEWRKEGMNEWMNEKPGYIVSSYVDIFEIVVYNQPWEDPGSLSTLDVELGRFNACKGIKCIIC